MKPFIHSKSGEREISIQTNPDTRLYDNSGVKATRLRFCISKMKKHFVV